MKNFFKNLYRHYRTPSTTKALAGVDKAITSLRAASDQHTRRAQAAVVLSHRFAIAAQTEFNESNRAKRVADRYENLIA